MEILILLVPLSVVLALLIGAGFWWSVKSGQFDDLEGPAHRILADDDTSDAIPGSGDSSQPEDSTGTQNPLMSVKSSHPPRR